VRRPTAGWFGHESLAVADPAVGALVDRERERQRTTLSLIASESPAPTAVHAALGSVFDDKTGEGYPGSRYHRGCEIADELEQLAIHRAKALFGADHANVQVHSGVNANLAVYMAALKPGDRVVSMDLAHGGHLSHGAAASITGRMFDFRHYGVRQDTETIDLDEVRRVALEHRPRLIIAGGSSYPRLIDYSAFRAIADEVSALLLVDMAHIAGLVAAGIVPSPVPHADFVTFTTYKTMLGPHGGIVLCRAEHGRALDRAVFPGTQGAPAMSQTAAKAVCLGIAAGEPFREVQGRIVSSAAALAATLAERGYRLVAGGTDTHLLLVDLRNKGLTGDRAEVALEAVGILVNRNPIPFDPEPIRITSGIRLGTSTIAVRGMGPPEAEAIAVLVDESLGASGDDAGLARVREAVAELCRRSLLDA
jgi:glycine hydroxymethyltransferase